MADEKTLTKRPPAAAAAAVAVAAAVSAATHNATAVPSALMARIDPTLPLLNTWSFYFDDGNFSSRSAGGGGALDASADFMTHLVRLGSFNSIQNFWSYFNSVDLNIHKICRHGRFNLRLFKQDIKPVWDQPSQASGGRWVIKSTPSSDLKKTRDIWFELLMAAVGEQLPAAQTIAGCVLACKPHRNEVQLWVSQPPYQAMPDTPPTTDASQTSPLTPEEEAAAAAAAQQLALVNQQAHDLKLKAVAHQMRRILRLSDSVRMSYIPHSYELEKARSSEADHAKREERRRINATLQKSAHGSTWPLRPPESTTSRRSPDKKHTRQLSRQEEETTTDELVGDQADIVEGPPASSSTPRMTISTVFSPSPRLLAAVSLSANPLPDDLTPLADDSRSIFNSMPQTPTRVAPAPTVLNSLLSTPPTVTPSDFHRFLIQKDSNTSTPSSQLHQERKDIHSPPPVVSPTTLHGPLASLLGLTPSPSPALPLSHHFSPPTSAPMTAFQSPAVMPQHSQQPLLTMPAGYTAALPPPVRKHSHPHSIGGVHVIGANGRPSSITQTPSSQMIMPSDRHMSRSERKQAQQWLDRVQGKQEQAKSWPHALLPTPMPASLVFQQAKHATHLAAMQANTVMQQRTSQWQAVPVLTNTDLARSRTESMSKSRQLSIASTTSSSGTTVATSANATPSSSCVSTMPSTSAASPVLDVEPTPAFFLGSPSATQIYSAGALPALELTEASPTPPARQRSRSLFNGSNSNHLVFTSTNHSPLLTAFKDAQSAAFLESQQANLRLSASVTPTNKSTDVTAPVTPSITSPSPSPKNALTTMRKSNFSFDAHENDQSLHIRVGSVDLAPSPGSKTSLIPSTIHDDVAHVTPIDGTPAPSPDPIDWEKRTRLDHGLPPMPPSSSSSSFKPMSREERKQALAMLSKVNSKRLQAQSWPRIMLTPANPQQPSSPSPSHTPGGSHLLPRDMLSPVCMSPMTGAGSPARAESPVVRARIPLAASNLTVDLRVLAGPGQQAPSPSLPRHVFSPPTHHYQSSGTLSFSAGMSTPSLHRTLSSQEHASGTTTPSGGHTPGGRAVTLGMGLRSRSRPSGSSTPLTLSTRTLSMNRATPTHSSNPSPSPSSCPSPQLVGRAVSDRPRMSPSPSSGSLPQLASKMVSPSTSATVMPAGLSTLVAKSRSSSSAGSIVAVAPPPLLMAVPPSSSSSSPNRVLYAIIALLTLMLVVMTVLLIKSRDDAQLATQLIRQSVLQATSGFGEQIGEASPPALPDQPPLPPQPAP